MSSDKTAKPEKDPGKRFISTLFIFLCFLAKNLQNILIMINL